MANKEPIKIDNSWEYIEEHPNFTGCLINSNKDIVWFKNGELHREDGPAFEWSDREKSWYLNNIRYTEQKWKIAVRRLKLERVLKQIEG